MSALSVRLRACCARWAVAAGKGLLTVLLGVAVFALAAQALAMVLAALALLLVALCLASLCMPEESRAVWAWVRETLGGWSRTSATGGEKADDPANSGTQAESGTQQAGSGHERGDAVPPADKNGAPLGATATGASGKPEQPSGEAAPHGDKPANGA